MHGPFVPLIAGLWLAWVVSWHVAALWRGKPEKTESARAFRLHFAIRLSSDCRAPVDSGQQLALRPLTTWPGKQNRPFAHAHVSVKTARLSEFSPRSRTEYPPTLTTIEALVEPPLLSETATVTV